MVLARGNKSPRLCTCELEPLVAKGLVILPGELPLHEGALVLECRIEYLYLEDSFPEAERIRMTHEKICAFFKER